MDDDLKQRLLPLEGGINFRDMGGYPADGGRRVRWRQLYRSGSTGRLTQADSEHLAEIGIRTVIDFRTSSEQLHDPSHWAQEHETIYWSREHEDEFGDLSEMATRGAGTTVEEALQVMENGYRNLLMQQAEAYGVMLRRISEGHVPAVIHCTAGKDRTGGGAALILAALGVPRTSIVSDFEKTAKAVDLRKAIASRNPNPKYAVFSNLDDAVLEVMTRSQGSFIEAFLDSIDMTYGSIEGYAQELGLSRTNLARMRDELLE